ncbi:MAG: hypothetical protein DDT40_00236 [candidate division WS2 bacterium]|uniref:Sec translocon accessory complex subunit YajC n=1 Tax=Psychracetigena formicireducens TaxID=2986056 RepID=A0A9E2BFN5_PSYF1|nr:hypothetical protein [Candidatus Psychracetigena formicireducens]MBT9144647.1 hypothetical protein [Candidatus Psychracetigena formicireducens]MBT9150070.1 hypothetical protein [Candidatus Psychracetigena formicireducens]
MQIDPNTFTTILVWVGFIVLIYFIMIRPQQMQQKKRKAMLGSLSRGFQIILHSGIIGVIREIDEQIISLEIAPKIIIKVMKEGVAQIWKGRDE